MTLPIASNLPNAVAPDWNLKYVPNLLSLSFQINAVAPDWNLKHVG